jgi:hypothetical protein
MPGTQTSKPSWWAKFLGRSPPMPSGGWTRESLRDYWRQMIATSPQDAPLSHAALAELLTKRGWIKNWLWPDMNRSPAPVLDKALVHRLANLPVLVSLAFLPLAFLFFTLVPKAHSFYPMIFLSENTLCISGGRGGSSGQSPFRCDALVWVVETTLLLSVVSSIAVAILFLRDGGFLLLRSSQVTKMLIRRGGAGVVLSGLLFLLLLTLFLIKIVIDSDVLPVYPVSIFLPLTVPLVNIVSWYILPVVIANLTMAFFYMTGRFPSWLEDLSP